MLGAEKMKDFKIKELPFPFADGELDDERLFCKDPLVFTPDNPLSEYGMKLRPLQIKKLKDWQAAEIELNKELIEYCKELTERCEEAFSGKFRVFERKGSYQNDPMYGYLSEAIGIWWYEGKDLNGNMHDGKCLSENMRKFRGRNCYYDIPLERHDVLMDMFVKVNQKMRRSYKSLPKLESIPELDMYLSVRGF